MPTVLKNHRGVTLVELMITIGVLAILAGIAIPLYNGYILESHLTAMRSEMAKLRVPIEDFRLENGTYNDAGPPTLNTYINETLTELNDGIYTYTLESVTSVSYDVLGTYAGGAAWVRCCNRFDICLDSDSSGSASPVACP